MKIFYYDRIVVYFLDNGGTHIIRGKTRKCLWLEIPIILNARIIRFSPQMCIGMWIKQIYV